MSLIAELKRRNVIRAGMLYAGAVWALAQGIAQLGPLFSAPDWFARAFVIAGVIGFPFWLAFSWFYEWTPSGLKRESDIVPDASIVRRTGRKLDLAIIGVLGVAVVLLLTDRFVVHKSGEGAALSDKSIAVLPFVDMSQAKDQEYFSDGLSEELLDLLAKTPQLKVIARTSSFSFKGKEADIASIAKQLAVATILEGSVRKSGNTLRVTAQLIRTSDSTHLWSDTYDRELTDVFKVQDEIAGAVVTALKLKLLPEQAAATSTHRTANIEAYNEYLRGSELYHRSNNEGWREAESAFRHAIALDPNYAPAWAGLARTLTFLSDNEPNAQAVAAAKQEALTAADKAIALAPDLADGYIARGHARFGMFWDWHGAQEDLDRAIALDPNSAEARVYRGQLFGSLGRLPEAIEEIRIALDHNPLSDFGWMLLGWNLIASDRTAEAREAVLRATTLNPESKFAWAYVGYVELFDGKLEAARTAFDRTHTDLSLYGTATIEYALGHDDASRVALATYTTNNAEGSAYQIAQIHAWRHEPDEAFAWLDRAFSQHDEGLTFVKSDTMFKRLHDDPRYAALVRKMGLPE